MSTTVVDPKPADAPVNLPPFEGDDTPVKTAAKPADKTKDKPDDVGELRKQLDAKDQRIRELSDSERYWAGEARGRSPAGDELDAPPAEPKAEPEEEETADEFLDRLSKQGSRAIAKEAEKAAAKAGYVRKEDVEKIAAKIASEIVERKAGHMTADAKLISEHPELRDENSPVFKATAVVYRQLIADDPELKKSPQTLFLAARLAKAELKAAGNGNRAGDHEQPGDYREDRQDDDRRRRIGAQQGDVGRGRSTPYEGDDELTPGQRDVITLFDKAGVTEQSYREERARLRRRS